MVNSDIYTPTTWGADPTFEVTCPSGQKCLARKLQFGDLVDLGMVDQMDTLGLLASEHTDPKAKVKQAKDRQASKKVLAEREATREQDTMRGIMKDPKKFGDLILMMDKIVAEVVVAPVLTRPVRIDEETGEEVDLAWDERKSDKVYTDTVDLGDKMYLFEVCFSGVSKIANFREEPAKDLGNLEDESGDADSSERVSRPV